MSQSVLVLDEREGQQRLDELLDLRTRTPAAARCPLCGKQWRSARWIARRRALRHALRIHGVRLFGWLV